MKKARYLELLSHSFPTSRQAASAIAHYSGELSLPKPTELYISDIHGEYEAFANILRTGCGSLQRVINEAFDQSLTDQEKAALTCLICYPQEKMDCVLSDEVETTAWYEESISQLLVLIDYLLLTHSHRELADALPEEFAVLTQDLLSLDYPTEIVSSLIATNIAAPYLEALCLAVRTLLVGKLHMVGDVYDRGPFPELIMDELANSPRIDIQWGNHDICLLYTSPSPRDCS